MSSTISSQAKAVSKSATLFIAGVLMTSMVHAADIKTLTFSGDGKVPNSTLPVVIYQKAFEGLSASEVQARLAKNSWSNSWVSNIFPYQHFHSNSHEVLAVLKGSAELMLGGFKGQKIKVNAGDILVLPAGTGHMRVSSSEDFSVTGAYPEGQDWNLIKADNITVAEYKTAQDEIKQVPIPKTDPWEGKSGPLLTSWKDKK